MAAQYHAPAAITRQSYAPAAAAPDNLLDTFGYMPSKEYARPAVQGIAPMRSLIWVGFANVVCAILPTNALHVEVPAGRYRRLTNPPALRSATGAFIGGSPTRGIYTGVGE